MASASSQNIHTSVFLPHTYDDSVNNVVNYVSHYDNLLFDGANVQPVLPLVCVYAVCVCDLTSTCGFLSYREYVLFINLLFSYMQYMFHLQCQNNQQYLVETTTHIHTCSLFLSVPVEHCNFYSELLFICKLPNSLFGSNFQNACYKKNWKSHTPKDTRDIENSCTDLEGLWGICVAPFDILRSFAVLLWILLFINLC